MIFFEEIKGLDDNSYYVYYMKYQLAPVILGNKSAMTFTVALKEEKEASKIRALKIIYSLDLRAMILRETSTSCILLIYCKKMIEKIISEPKKKAVLVKLGYPVQSVFTALSYLRKRYAQTLCPAEIGIFLGFPLEDVEDYMSGTNKKCLRCGYWQVYNNLDQAEKTFMVYDQAKEMMLSQLLSELKRSS